MVSEDERETNDRWRLADCSPDHNFLCVFGKCIEYSGWIGEPHNRSVGPERVFLLLAVETRVSS